MKTKNSLEAKQLLEDWDKILDEMHREIEDKIKEEGHEDIAAFKKEYNKNQEALAQFKVDGKENTKQAQRIVATLEEQSTIDILIGNFEKLKEEYKQIGNEFAAHTVSESKRMDSGEQDIVTVYKNESEKLLELLKEEGYETEPEFLKAYNQKKVELQSLEQKSGGQAKIKRLQEELSELEKINLQIIIIEELRAQLDSSRMLKKADEVVLSSDPRITAEHHEKQDSEQDATDAHQEIATIAHVVEGGEGASLYQEADAGNNFDPRLIDEGAEYGQTAVALDTTHSALANYDTPIDEAEVILQKQPSLIFDETESSAGNVIKSYTAAVEEDKQLFTVEGSLIEETIGHASIEAAAVIPILHEPPIVAVSNSALELSHLLTIPELEDSIKFGSTFEARKYNEIYQRYTYLMATMPECAEKCITILCIYFEIEGVRKKLGIAGELLSPDQLEIILNKLKIQLKDEYLTDMFVNATIEKISRLTRNFSEKSEELSKEFINLLKYIQPVDVDQMLIYIDKAISAAEKIKGKDIFLLLGGTGTGKTTTIHFLAGSKMEKTTVRGLKHIAPVQITDGELAEFVTSPFSRSETRSINPIFIDAHKCGAQKVSEVILCDSPGFCDTDGVELDIANGIGIVRAVKGCQSVKPIVLVSQQSIGDRSEGLTKLAGILIMFIPDIKHVLKSFNYVFTKYTKEDGKEIYPILSQKLAVLSAEEKASRGFVELLHDMVEKTKTEVIILDPINDDPGTLLDIVSSAPPIENPKDIFHDFASPESLAKLKEQLYKHKISIEKALEHINIPLLSYKMNQMALVNKNVIINESQRLYEKCIEGVSNLITNLLSQVDQRLSICMDVNNTNVEADVQLIIQTIFNLYSLEAIRKVHLPHLSNLEEACFLRVQHYCKELQERITNKYTQQLTESSSAMYSNMVDLEKLHLLLTVFKEQFVNIHPQPEFINQLETIYINVCQKIEAQYHMYCGLAKDALLHNNFNEFVDNMDAIDTILKKYQQHLDTFLLQRDYDDLVENCKMLLKKLNEQVESVLIINDSVINVKEDDLQYVKNAFDIINKISSVHGIEKYISKVAIDEAEEKLKYIVTNFVRQIHSHIVEPMCEQYQINRFNDLYSIIKKLDFLRESSEIQYVTSGPYQDLVKSIKSYITKLSHEGIQYLNWLAESKLGTAISIDYSVVQRSFVGLQNASIFDNHSEKLYSGELDELKSYLDKFIQRVNGELSDFSLHLESISKLQQVLEISKQLASLIEIEKLVSSEANAEKNKQYIDQKVEEVLAQINLIFSEDIMLYDISKMTRCMDFLWICSLYASNQHFDVLNNLIKRGIESTERFFIEINSKLDSAHSKIFIEVDQDDAQLHKLSKETTQLLILLSDIRDSFTATNLIAKDNTYTQYAQKTTNCTALTAQWRVLFNIFDVQSKTILDKWTEGETSRLRQHQSLLMVDASELEAGRIVDKINAKVIVANEFKAIDRLLPKELSYTSTLSSLELAMRTQKMAKTNEFELLTSTGNYREAENVYNQVVEADPELKKDLDTVIGKLLVSTISYSKELLEKTKKFVIDEATIGMADIILVEFNRLNDAKKLISNLSSQDATELDTLLDEIQTTIQGQVYQYKQLLFKYIHESRFDKVESCFKVLRIISALCCDIKITDNCNIILRSIDEILKDSEEMLNRCITENIEIYSSLDISDYAQNPPLIFMNHLQEAGESIIGIDYSKHREVLKQIIIKKILDAIEKVKNEPASADSVKKTKLITELSPFIPTDLSANYASQLGEAQEQVKQKTEELRRMLDELASANKLKELCDYLSQYSESCQYDNAYIVSQHIAQLINNTITRFKVDLDKGDLSIVLKSLPQSWDDWWYYKNKLTAITERLPGWESHFNCIFINTVIDDMVTSIINEILAAIKATDLGGSITIRSSYKLIQTHFEKYKALLNLLDEYQDFRIKKPGDLHLFDDLQQKAPELNIKILDAVNKIAQFLLKNQQNFVDGILSTNLSSTREVLDTVYEYRELIDNIQIYMTSDAVERLMPEVKHSMQTYMSYRNMCKHLSEQVIKLKDNIKVPLLHNPELLNANHTERDNFYKNLSRSYTSMVSARFIAEHVDEKIIDLKIAAEECKAHIISELMKIKHELQVHIGNMPYEDNIKYNEFNVWLDNLRSFKDNFEEGALVQEATSVLKDIERDYEARLQILRDTIPTLRTIDEIIDKLILLKLMSMYVPSYHRKVTQEIDAVLLILSKSEQGAQKIATLGLALRQIEGDQQDPAMRLINEHTVFKSYAISIRNQKTLRYTFADVLKDLKGDEINAKQLETAMKQYEELYWPLVEDGLIKAEEVKKKIIQDSKIIMKSTDNTVTKIVKLTANLFAYWTLDNSDNYKEMLEIVDKTAIAGVDKNYLLQPHAAQVISIFRLLGVDISHADKLTNHLVQIGTGEGKSVTLAITASVLALFGYTVDCACYSKYLSQRDYDAFSKLFEALHLSEYIHYGTFNKLSEDFINQQGDVRELVLSYINNGSKEKPIQRASEPKREKILLIDEVDVFFSKDFYGNYYRPLAQLRNESIIQLIQYIWNNRHNSATLTYTAVSESNEFKTCCAAFRGWEFLIEEATKEMLNDIKTFDGHEYIVISDKIGYKDQDAISFDITYGYKTLFAYFKEYTAGTITQSSLDAQLAITINTGTYSYAEVPKRYKLIMGVTGTLATLSAPEKEILKSYGIKKSTFMPSVYGSNQLEFAGDTSKDVVIEAFNSGYYVAIGNEINKRMQGGGSIKRAVLVFFKNKAILDEFCKSSVLNDLGIKDKVKLITEEVSNDEKEGLIAQAAIAGSVTLLTADFGRGTDFKCYDDRMNAAGGVHVIQTFVSDSLSEEVQIKGRTARQGSVGSYSMVLLGPELERYGISDEEIQRMRATSKLYTTINQKRIEFFEKQFPENVRNISQILKDHNLSEKFIADLLVGNFEAVKEFLRAHNQFGSGYITPDAFVARTICLMDATGSMQPLLTKAKNTVHLMFERATQILQEKNVRARFELQFVIYRNYDCQAERLLQYSGWETSASNLRQFMNSIEAKGGTWQPEAIEIGLWHVNQMAETVKVNQVVLIGDAPPNPRELVTKGREEYLTEQYWEGTKFSVPTYVDDEIRKLKDKQIPVHAFYVDADAKASFEEIATISGGISGELDIDSAEGAERLTQVVTERILENIGGGALVELYRAKYVRGYVTATTKDPLLFSVTANGINPGMAQGVDVASAAAGAEQYYKDANKIH